MTGFDVRWAQLPDGAALGDVPGVGIDAEDRVYAFTRGEHPVVVFDRDGRYLDSWGHGVFTAPHGLHVGSDGFLYCTDDGDNTVRKCTPDGTVVLTFGAPEPFMSGRPFCRCTNAALGPDGDIFVTDGYGNARVHRFSPDGDLIHSWGASGTDPGQFYIPHDVVCDAEGWVYVADRENHRIQVFDSGGELHAVWRDLHRPAALALSGGRMYVGELGPMFRSQVPFGPDLGARVSVLDGDGAVVDRFGAATVGTRPDQFVAPHGIAVDSRGDVYVGEVAHAAWPTYDDEPPPRDLTTLRKLRLP
ncbi:MAG: hypothetical protein JWN32_3582 [Solirubrobacterales bacterium]|nr:hypothetical protein [Solirubrobacterales bacterium]